MSGQFQSSLQNSLLLKKIEFFGGQNALFGRPQRPNAIRCDMKFYAYLYFQHIGKSGKTKSGDLVFPQKMATPKEGRGWEDMQINWSAYP